MNIYILLIILFIFFLIIFIYYLLNSRLIKFRVDIQQEKHKYAKIKENEYTCENRCTKDFCCEYHNQKIKYDLCKECKKDNKCYDITTGNCIKCRNNYTCEQLYGCGDKGPVDPVKNFCTRCWIKS